MLVPLRNAVYHSFLFLMETHFSESSQFWLLESELADLIEELLPESVIYLFSYCLSVLNNLSQILTNISLDF
jgi:hypothetical protein